MESNEILAVVDSVSTEKGIEKDLIFGIQFHPEVYHTNEGKKLLSNFWFIPLHNRPVPFPNLDGVDLKKFI